MLAALSLVAALTFAAGQQPPATAVVAGITIHGNAATPDDEVRRLAGIRVGMPFEENTLSHVEGQLNGSGRFEHVQVLNRGV